MNILLTNKEIKEALKAKCVYSDTPSDEIHQMFLDVRKAQAKKMMDYLSLRAFTFQPNGEGATVVISCDWQALLDEVSKE